MVDSSLWVRNPRGGYIVPTWQTECQCWRFVEESTAGFTTGVAEERDAEPLVGAVKSETSSASENISELLSTVSESSMRTLLFTEEQQKNSYLRAMHKFLEKQQLPEDPTTARRIALQAPMFIVSDEVLYFIDPKPVHCRRIAVLKHLCKDLLDKTHWSRMGG